MGEGGFGEILRLEVFRMVEYIIRFALSFSLGVIVQESGFGRSG